MEKAGALIERLLELYRNNAGKEQLRITAQLLLHELEDDKKEAQNTREMISVILPTYLHLNISNEPEEPSVIPEIKQGEKHVETKSDIIPEP